MYAPEFDYYRAGSVSEAAGLLRKYPGSKLLAGGQSLIPLLKLRLAAPVAVIDIGRIRDLKGITVKGGTIRVGAMTTHAELAASSELAEQCHALAQAAAGIGDPAVRNRGTIGGNVAHADPASDRKRAMCGFWVVFQSVSSPDAPDQWANAERGSIAFGIRRCWTIRSLITTSAFWKVPSTSPPVTVQWNATLFSTFEWTCGAPDCLAFSGSMTAGSGS